MTWLLLFPSFSSRMWWSWDHKCHVTDNHFIVNCYISYCLWMHLHLMLCSEIPWEACKCFVIVVLNLSRGPSDEFCVWTCKEGMLKEGKAVIFLEHAPITPEFWINGGLEIVWDNESQGFKQSRGRRLDKLKIVIFYFLS